MWEPSALRGDSSPQLFAHQVWIAPIDAQIRTGRKDFRTPASGHDNAEFTYPGEMYIVGGRAAGMYNELEDFQVPVRSN